MREFVGRLSAVVNKGVCYSSRVKEKHRLLYINPSPILSSPHLILSHQPMRSTSKTISISKGLLKALAVPLVWIAPGLVGNSSLSRKSHAFVPESNAIKMVE